MGSTWIKPGEKQPDDSARVLAYYQPGLFAVVFRTGRWWWVDGVTVPVSEPAFWMSLPEPPRLPACRAAEVKP